MRSLLLGVFLCGCGVNQCKQGTLLVNVELSGSAAQADLLNVEVVVGAAGEVKTNLDHEAGVADGTIEIDFPSGYPAGQTVTVTVTATRGGQPVGRSLAIALLNPGCDVTSVSIGDPAPVGGGAIPDGGSVMSMPVPADPEFKSMTTWTLAGGATIDPTAPGLDDVGQLILDRDAICKSAGNASQQITMPSFDAAGPFALIHTVKRDCTSSSLGCMGGDVAVRFRDGAIPIPTTDTLVKSRTCLGARAFDGTFGLIVSAGDKNDCNDPMLASLDLRVDRISIVSDPSCPSPGSIPDGDFDGDSSQWQLQLGNGTATIDPGLGVSGSQAGHITTSQLCQSPRLRGIQSVPTGAQVALSLYVKGTPGKAALIGEETNLARWASVTGSGMFDTPRICVPEYAKGMVLPILLSTETPQGACSTLDVRDFVFDQLSFVTEASCPMTTNVIDPGFERQLAVAQWNLEFDDGGTAGLATSTVIADATQAHGGNNVLQLQAKGFCTSARANTVITVPQPASGAGPALKFFYRTPGIDNTLVYASAQTAQVKLPASATWQQATLCLDPARGGQGQYFEVAMTAAGICGRTFPSEPAFFDDFEATTDPTCPTQ
jgi:hypothetical protein